MNRSIFVAASIAAMAFSLSACGKKVDDMPVEPVPAVPLAPPSDSMAPIPPQDGSMPDTPPVNPMEPTDPAATSPATSNTPPVTP